MNPTETGWLLAHRLALAYLVKALRQAIPAEADPATIQATVTMLQQSVPPMLAGLPPPLQVQVEEAAAAELARILHGGRFANLE